jgi:hypothetical protein
MRESVEQQLSEDLAHLEADPPDEKDEFAVDDDASFSQRDVDRIVTDRLNRQRSQFDRQIADLKQKYADFDELKEKAGKFDALEAEQLSDRERLEAERDKAAQERDEAKSAAAAATQAAHERARRADIVAAAAAAGADPDLTYAYMRDRDFKVTAPKAEGEDAAQTYEVTVADDGQVTGHEDAVKAVIAAKPGLVGQTPEPGPGPSDGGARTPVQTPDLKAQIQEAESKGDFTTSRRLKSELFQQANT